MASKSKGAREHQKAYWKGKLDQRIAFLKDQGVTQESTLKDSGIRHIRAKIRETERRLRAIESKENKGEEVARLREKRLAEKQDKTSRKKTEQEEGAVSKRQQKKQKKREQKVKE